MQALIVYESMYGNTRRIAEAIAEGVHAAAPDSQVSCLPVAEATADATRLRTCSWSAARPTCTGCRRG
nr:flavodoxin domain-containing protein [Streptomyces sp. TLI_235]